MRGIAIVALALSVCAVKAQGPATAQGPPAGQGAAPAFEVATIKPTALDAKAGRYITMQGTNRFVAKYYTLKLLIAAAYDLSPKVISGGAGWVDDEHFDIEAVTPGDTRPARAEQMAMLRTLLNERFRLSFHREAKEFSIYALEVDKRGVRLKESTAAASDPAQLISTVYPPARIHLPAKNATMSDFASLLQRALLDRPVVDRTGLTGRYDFDLDWAADETQFSGEVPVAGENAQAPPFFRAIEEQLGLRIEATRGEVAALVIDHTELPGAN
ncbi:MAG: TIGR03435 family protein [Terracidiphilus sp.]|nr:TIGR03435 family protein [Terracidiphilus sp.]MDR3799542.1 TIGR03435 family protein [Terracidiphilus sp.]